MKIECDAPCCLIIFSHLTAAGRRVARLGTAGIAAIRNLSTNSTERKRHITKYFHIPEWSTEGKGGPGDRVTRSKTWASELAKPSSTLVDERIFTLPDWARSTQPPQLEYKQLQRMEVGAGSE